MNIRAILATGYIRNGVWPTVVPDFDGPCWERPPVMCGHGINVPIHFNVKLSQISGHLPNTVADSHL